MNSTNLNTTTELSNSRVYRVGGCPYFDFYNADCMDIMKQYPDKHFDLAIVDPPYGIKISSTQKSAQRKGQNYITIYNKKDWDNAIPVEDYWIELFRISRNQIVWGGNYFNLPLSKGWIFWDKEFSPDFSFAAGELAWTSFDIALKKFTYGYWKTKNNVSNNNKIAKSFARIHPTQKPEDLYSWLINEYAKPDFKILDTHLGSASIAIAVHKANVLDKMNLHLTGIEIDADYFQAAMNRIKKHVAQTTLKF